MIKQNETVSVWPADFPAADKQCHLGPNGLQLDAQEKGQLILKEKTDCFGLLSYQSNSQAGIQLLPTNPCRSCILKGILSTV